MSLRSSTRRGRAFARKQKKYFINYDESESEADDDDETEAEMSSNQKFGGVLATLKNDSNNNNNSSRSQRRKTLKKMTSPPMKKLSQDESKARADENGKTPPPRSVIMTRSAMRAISPLTVQKLPKQQQRRKNAVQDTDSFASGDDDDDEVTQHQSLSSVEEKSQSLSSTSKSENSEREEEEEEEEAYEDSFEDSESSSEFEFGVDDEEFVPDEEDEDDDSAAMSEFIVDDVSEELPYGGISNDSGTAKKYVIEEEDDDDTVDVPKDGDSAKSDDSNNDAYNEEDVMNPDSEGETHVGIESASSDVDIEEDGTENVEETPVKTGLPRRTLDFDSPEPQMAMIVDDDEDFDDDDGDVLVATIIDSNDVDGDTIVLTFDEEEEVENDVEHNEEALSADGDDREMAKTVVTMSKTVVTNGESKAQRNDNDKHNENKKESERIALSSEKEQLVPSAASQKVSKAQSSTHYRQEGEVKRGKWALGAKIGVGSFGTVHVGMNTQTGVLMAIKKFKMEGAIMQDIKTEVQLMRSLRHTNIVRYLGAQMDDEFLHIFQEWVPGGSVSSLLSKFGAFSIEVIQSYISQTLDGLNYLHDNDIMHRDIKGSNILVNDEGVVKLADFGASKKLKNLAGNMMMSLTVRGTPYFMAPEVFEEKYSAKADVWGIGCVAFQMVTATPPWKELGFTNPISLFNHMRKHKGPPPMEHPGKESFSIKQQSSWARLQEFVGRCFEQDPSERPSAKELLNDPFISKKHEIDIDDDESTQYRGLFSPGNESKNNSSPKNPSLLAKQPSPGHCSTGTKNIDDRRMSWMSPPRSSKKNRGKKNSPFAKRETPPKQPKAQNSPSPDTREWPVWAKSQLEKQNKSKQSSQDNLSDLMDSLALSEDSSHIGQRQLTERRSSSIGGSTVSTNLVGLNFLESTKK